MTENTLFKSPSLAGDWASVPRFLYTDSAGAAGVPLDERIMRISLDRHQSPEQRAALRDALSDAAHLCDAIAVDVSTTRGRASVKTLADVAKRCADAIWAMREKIQVTETAESSLKWIGSVTPEMISAGRANAANASHSDAPVDLHLEAIYRAMRALEEEDANVRI